LYIQQTVFKEAIARLRTCILHLMCAGDTHECYILF